MERELEFERVFFLFFRRRCRPMSFILTSFSCALSPPPPPSPPPQWATSPTACPRRCSPTSSPRWGPSRRHGEFGGLSVVCVRGGFIPAPPPAITEKPSRSSGGSGRFLGHPCPREPCPKKKKKRRRSLPLHSARDKNASLSPPRPLPRSSSPTPACSATRRSSSPTCRPHRATKAARSVPRSGRGTTCSGAKNAST